MRKVLICKASNSLATNSKACCFVGYPCKVSVTLEVKV